MTSVKDPDHLNLSCFSCCGQLPRQHAFRTDKRALFSLAPKENIICPSLSHTKVATIQSTFSVQHAGSCTSAAHHSSLGDAWAAELSTIFALRWLVANAVSSLVNPCWWLDYRSDVPPRPASLRSKVFRTNRSRYARHICVTVPLLPRTVKNDGETKSVMWSTNDSITRYPFPNMSCLVEEKNVTPIPCLVHTTTNCHLFPELFPQKTPILQSVTQARMNQAISSINFTWCPSKDHFLWWLSSLRATRRASCFRPYAASCWSLWSPRGSRHLWIHSKISKVPGEARRTVRGRQ